MGKEEPHFTPDERHDAEIRRQIEVGQLEARLGRLPSFSKSSDGIAFTVPISPRKPGDLPVPLQAVRSIKLLVPLLYPMHPCRIELLGVNKEMAHKTESSFNDKAEDNRGLSLIAHVNYFAQYMHTLAIEPDTDNQDLDQAAVFTDGLRPEEKKNVVKHVSEAEDDRSHIKFIPRPPEWTMGSDEESESDDDFSDSYDSGDESEGVGSQDGQDEHEAQGSTSGNQSTTVSSFCSSLDFTLDLKLSWHAVSGGIRTLYKTPSYLNVK